VTDWVYSCSRATDRLVEFVRLLAGAGVLSAPPDEGLLRHCVQRCNPCCHNRGIRRCEGWHTIVERGVLSFRPFVLPGHNPVRIDLSGNLSFRRMRPEKADGWEARPLLSSTVTLELVDLANERLLERHHHDLANPGQDGPIWHLQYGGNPAGTVESLPTSWIDPPRWAMSPMDLTLLGEMIVYNFFRAEWDELNARGDWVRLILDVEQLVMSRFAEHMQAHFRRDRPQRDRTWLTAQDNTLSGLNPRPST
jgi:hypothetical protein